MADRRIAKGMIYAIWQSTMERAGKELTVGELKSQRGGTKEIY